MSQGGRKKTFKRKVLVVFLLISLVPLFVVASSNLFFIWKTRQQNIVELENLALENANQKLDAFVNGKLEGLKVEFSLPDDVQNTAGAAMAIGSISNIPPGILLDLLLYAYDTSKPEYLELADMSGNIVAKIAAGGEPQFSRHYIDLSAASGYRLATTSATAVINGRIVRIFSDIEADISENTSFQEAKENELYFSDAYFNPDGTSRLIKMAAQINVQDKVIGIVTADIDLKPLDAIIGSIPLGNAGYLTVINKGGLAITVGDEHFARVGEDLRDIPRMAELLAGTYHKQNQYDSYLNPAGVDVAFGAAKNDRLGWYILAQWPVDDAFAVIRNVLWLSLAISLLTLVIIIVLGIILTRQVIRPINELTHGAKEIAKGNLDYEIEMATGDEFELLSGQFNEMVKVLKENQKLRDEFVFIAAHELRTPVTAIKGYLSMLLDGTFGEISRTTRENLDIINASNERLVQLVHDLLEIARSDAGKMKLDMKELKIAEHIIQVIKELKSLADQKGIEVIYKQDSEAMVMADEFKIKEVLVNIIGNAIKYTKTNGDIIIYHQKHDKYLVTHIEDHGIGMTEDEIAQLFGKFYRAQNDDTKEIEGTGLGLFIVKQIIEHMGGEIWVKSEKGKGSTFSFRLKKV